MLEFTPISYADGPFLRATFLRKPSLFNDYTVGTRLLWKDYFAMEMAHVDGHVFFKNTIRDQIYFEFPISDDIDAALDLLDAYCERRGLVKQFAILTDEEVEILQKRYPHCQVESDPALDDYLYDPTAYTFLRGKKMGKKRNHLNAFERDYPSTVEIITKENAPLVADFLDRYIGYQQQDDSLILNDEAALIHQCLERFDECGMVGVCIKVMDQIVAFSLGEVFNKILFVHVEKAVHEMQGLYQKLAAAFAQTFYQEDLLYVNREEDLGSPGLRKSKESWQPVKMATKKNLIVLDK